ncbi:cyclase [Oscillospiraceae bacterium]|nr:cyclase [Oscillospiraceae bacterium]BDF76453.1 cyclase [Oscillospiraceae bacterium]
MKIIDLSHTYRPGMTGMSKWHPVVEFRRMGKLEEIGMNTSSILLGSHIATHMDAASHFIPGGYSIEATTLERCVGEVTVVDVRHRGKGDCLRVADLEPYQLKPRVLLCFGYCKYWADQAQYNVNYPYIGMEAAQYLLDKGVELVAMDIPSPDRPPAEGEERFPVHKLMLSHNIIFVEALANTQAVDFSARYTLVALPLKLEGVDASPCRVILIEKGAL